jgi:SpoVK/Ycf46/Vps4 family AAA+-type ATPase
MGMAIATTTKCTPLEGFQIAKESLLSGKGLKALTTLQELSKATNPKRESLDRNSIIKTLKYKMNILDKIIVDKRREVILKKSIIPVSQLEASVFLKRLYP